MAQDIIEKLEDQKIVLEKEIAEKIEKMRDFSKQVSEIQVEILSLKGELKAVLKMLNSLKEEK